jgi:hypothetical protein
MNRGMSAIGPKQTSVFAPHMSAFGGKADMTLCGNPLLQSQLGVKRTWAVAAHMPAFDPKRTFDVALLPQHRALDSLLKRWDQWRSEKTTACH